MNFQRRFMYPIVRKSVRKTYRRPLRVLADEPMGPHKREHSRRTYGHREPLPLMIAGRDSVVAYACGTCGTVHSAKHHGLAHAREQAARCCLWRDRCTGCGRDVERQRGKCSECWSRDAFERTRDRARKARIIEDDGSPVCCELSHGDWGDGYSSSVSAHLEAWADQMGEFRGDAGMAPEFVCPPPPPFVFATTSCTPQVSQQHIDESMLDDLPEDFDITDLPGHDELCAAVERFNAIQSPASYMIDYSRVIVIDAKRFSEFLDEQWDGMIDVRYRQRFDPARIPVYEPRPACVLAAEAALMLKSAAGRLLDGRGLVRADGRGT